MGYFFVALTIVFTVYGQLAIKWQMGRQQLPDSSTEKITFLLMQLLNPWIASGFASAFVAALCWMAAMTKLPISQAYPWMSLSFVLVIFVSSLLLGEELTVNRIAGALVILVGLAIVSR